MVTHYDDKGKIFTQVVSKQAVNVTIHTLQHVVRGQVHIRPDARIKDELSREERFLAVTGATVCNHRNEELFQCDFMVVNIDQIVWLIPDDDLKR